MKIDDQLLDKLSRLARLKIPDDEKESMKDSLSEILTWMEKLQEIDTSGISPLTEMSSEVNHTRKDEVIPAMNRDELLQNAPESDDQFIKVPLVKKNK